MGEFEQENTNDNTINVGVLFSQSGPSAVTEKAHLEGTLLAICEINANGGILGKQISPIIADPGSDPQRYPQLAKELLSKNQHVPVIFGCCLSASRKSVLPIIERFGCILFYPSVYEGFEYSPSIIYTGALPNQMIIPLIQYIFKNHGKRLFLVGSDYVYPREINRIVKEFLDESNGVVVGEEYIKLGEGDAAYWRVIEKIKNSQFDIVFSTVVGQETARFYEVYKNAFEGTDNQPIASLTTSESELALMSEKARQGNITSSPYFNAIVSYDNNVFIDKYQKKFGKDKQVSVYNETAYYQVYLFAKALELSGENCDFETLSSSLNGLKINSPQGLVEVDGETNHVYLIPRVGISTENGTFNVVWEGKEPVKPDPYLLSYNRTILSKLLTDTVYP